LPRLWCLPMPFFSSRGHQSTLGPILG
jgi:hypothetical protein